MQWLDFWNRQHRVYVNERHRAVHYRQVADDIISVIPGASVVVLDFGCGEALEAQRVAAASSHLYLVEAASSVRDQLRQRLQGSSAISVLADAELTTIPEASVDLIVTNSVLQYLRPEELDGLLRRWRPLLKPSGVLVLADVLPPEGHLLDDVRSLLGTGARHGFLLAAIGGLFSLLFSDYRRLRRELGLTRYAERVLVERLARAGFVAERSARNFGFNPSRMTFHARPG